MTDLSMILLTSALFLAALLSLTANSRIRSRITGLAAAAAACVGMVLYGYGFAWTLGPGPVAALRALLALCRMFAGVNELSAIQATPWFSSQAVLTVFWLGHFLAFYATASAAIATLGGRLLRFIRFALLRRGDLLVVFGVSAESVAFARSQLQHKRQAVLFICDTCDAALESAVVALGGVVDGSAGALEPDAAYLRRIGLRPGARRLCTAALHEDGMRNLAWAQQLRSALGEAGIRPEQTRLILRGVREQQAGSLLGGEGEAFGDVYAFDAYSLAARLMIRRMPPCQTLRFDGTGRADDDFHAVIVGFGRMGRAALRQLVMNGQFCGSTMRVDIFDPHAQKGSLLGSALLQNHDIRFHADDGKSDAFYRFVDEQRDALRYIVLCTGERRENQEIAQELADFLSGTDRIPALVQLTPDGLIFTREGEEIRCEDVYGSEALDAESMDRLAMLVNQQYCRHNGLTPEQNWRRCDSFSRMSCRAFADFAHAFLWASGTTAEEAASGAWTPDPALLDHLAQTEHRRWCAFHEAMGYATMPPHVWQARADAYAAQVATHGYADLRIGKDPVRRLHACIIPWDGLDALSERENAVTGGHVDYKAMDRDNVLALPALLREELGS